MTFLSRHTLCCPLPPHPHYELKMIDLCIDTSVVATVPPLGSSKALPAVVLKTHFGAFAVSFAFDLGENDIAIMIVFFVGRYRLSNYLIRHPCLQSDCNTITPEGNVHFPWREK